MAKLLPQRNHRCQEADDGYGADGPPSHDRFARRNDARSSVNAASAATASIASEFSA